MRCRRTATKRLQSRPLVIPASVPGFARPRDCPPLEPRPMAGLPLERAVRGMASDTSLHEGVPSIKSSPRGSALEYRFPDGPLAGVPQSILPVHADSRTLWLAGIKRQDREGRSLNAHQQPMECFPKICLGVQGLPRYLPSIVKIHRIITVRLRQIFALVDFLSEFRRQIL